jgi:hypothetical protein
LEPYEGIQLVDGFYIGVATAPDGKFYSHLERTPVKFIILTEHHAMKAYWWSGGITPRIL